MIDYERIRKTTDCLIASLIKWESKPDGFYHSAPLVTSKSSPSFTNTGIVLQAFNESGNTYYSHELADKLLHYLEKNKFKPFPHEKADGGNSKSHILCNTWPVFSILDCYPTKAVVLTPLCIWFLDNQNEDGSWNLIPNEETKYPLFTAYSLSVLLQFKICYENMSYADKGYISRLDNALKKGLGWLLGNRADKAIQEKLLLWPASLNSPQKNLISFSTSAISMHIFSKAGRHFGKEDWIQMVEDTFSAICDNFSVDNPESLTVSDMNIDIWDQIHVNESSLNYFFSFFSPINLTTLLKLAESNKFKFSDKYLNFIIYFIDWILNNTIEDKGSYGVKGGKHFNEIKTWSTAQSVIVLSRILNTAYVLLPKMTSFQSTIIEQKLVQQEEEICSQKEINTQTNLFIKKVKEILEENYSVDQKKTKVVVNMMFIILCIGALCYLPDPIQKIWPDAEGKIWLYSQIVMFIAALFGFKLSKLSEKCEQLFTLGLNWLIGNKTKVTKLKKAVEDISGEE